MAKQSTYILIPPDKYSGKQAIVTSDRVLLNAKSDAVLIFANKAIGLSSAGTLNFDCDVSTTFNSPKILLGLGSTEPLLLGNKTVDFLTDLLKKLDTLAESLSKVSVHIGDANYPLMDVNMPAQDLKQEVERLLGKIDELKSKQNFTL